MATRTKKRRSKSDDEEVPARRSKKGGSSQSVKLDLRKTERGKKGGHRYPESEYKIQIEKAERKTSQGGNTQIVMTCTILEPEKYKGKPLIDRLTLTEKAMFRVGWLLDACGIKWSNAVVDFPLKKLAGKVIGVQLYDDEYSGRISSKVAEYYSEEEIDEFLNDEDEDDEDEDDEDLEDDDEEDEDEDEDEDEGDEYDDMDRVALKKAARKIDMKVTKSMSDDDIRDALREEDDEDEDDEELDDDDL